MQTRRVFLKTILGLGAVVLPWSFLPTRFGEAVKTGLGRPPVEFVLPPKLEPDEGSNSESLTRTAMDDILALSDSVMQGRRAGSVGEAKAAEYLSTQLRNLGLTPMGDPKTGFTQGFTIPHVVETRVNGRLTFKPGGNRQLRTPSVNVIGGLMGENPQETILLSAHYDHLGVFEGQVYPGANDNASGVGCILAIGIIPLKTQSHC